VKAIHSLSRVSCLEKPRPTNVHLDSFHSFNLNGHPGSIQIGGHEDGEQ
jgi:hypothetical protein